jgi:hypothetical protein
MELYQLTLKNEKLVFYNRISWLIILIHGLLYTYLSFFTGDKILSGTARVQLVFLVILLAADYFIRKNKKLHVGFHIYFILLMVGWIGMRLYWLSAVPVVFDLLYVFASRKFIAVFSPQEIRYPSFPARRIKWEELTNVILKWGLLTIDFRNNKLIQQKIDESTMINEAEFNEFCKEQLKRK